MRLVILVHLKSW